MNVRKRYIGQVTMLTLILAALCLTTGLAAAAVAAGPGEGGAEGTSSLRSSGTAATRWDLTMGIAISVAGPCLAAGYAVGKVGAAALGAASEKPELLTRSLIFVALAEGIAIYGLLVAVLLYIKLPV